MANPTIEDVKKLNGKDVAMLTAEEKNTYNFFALKGRKYGVSLSTNSLAPETELATASSESQYLEIVAKYPSVIDVQHQLETN